MTKTYDIRMKRIYTDASQADGTRALADRLWPRGIKKAEAKIDLWCKKVTPSNELRKSYHSKEIKFEAFAERYLNELNTHADELLPLMRAARQGTLTLLSAVKELEHSHVPVLRYAIESALRHEDEQADGSEPSSPVCFATSFTNNE
ncbi:hypothetical protein CWE21_06325 [Pseudidiomarina aquimaris]|uniref:DUF488 domain-containing protein n=1 Tax=Pseudidiomarina aquimaris TaxID=641841 RepID=A0A432XHQ4_9GAMM|nr:DUF488 family protein [Pseudidiomarina aquimaris]RUO48156.1 hypothetical protein CWE21_06325 [Pseudidiomarina aquimaris]